MNPLVVVNFYRETELPKVAALAKIIGPNFRGVSHLDTPLTSWRFDSMRKFNVEWTKRFMRQFLENKSFDVLIKVDPDTVINGPVLPVPDLPCHVAGDFRKSWFGWVWFGGYHFFSRPAVEAILADPDYTGNCPTQDMTLAQSVSRLKLTAYNLPFVNCCKTKNDGPALVEHRGGVLIDRLPPGRVSF